MPRVVHFEIHAERPERAIRFYSQLFRWEFTKWTGPEDYWLIKTGDSSTPGIDGGLIPRAGQPEGRLVNAYVCTIDVPDIDASLAEILRQGGEVVVSRMPVRRVCWLAYARDTEGNLFGLMQADPAAQ